MSAEENNISQEDEDIFESSSYEEEEESEEEDENVIMIPVHAGDNMFVKVSVSELPDDATDIVDILKAELAPLDIWLKFAVQYFKQGKIEPFKVILKEGSQEDLEEFYRDAKGGRIAILNVLAAYYVGLAMKEKDEEKRQTFFEQATVNYNKADKIDMDEETTWVGKGVLLVCKGFSDRANDYFDTVLEKNKNNIPALLGKACIAYNKTQYEEALSCYKKAIEINPMCPANVRLGMALCYARLKREDLARMAFERVLELDGTDVNALVGLAILRLNSDDGDVREAMQLLKKAYQRDPTNSVVLNHLSNHFFYKGDYDKVRTLARDAVANTKVREIQAESLYHLARAFHAQEDFDNAFQYYYRAVKLWGELDVAQFGLAQMFLYKGQHSEAISTLETLLKKYPDNYETIRLLGTLYAMEGKKEKATYNLKRATETNPHDVDVWLEYAQLLECDNYSLALIAYEKAAGLMMDEYRMKEGSMKMKEDKSDEVGIVEDVDGTLGVLPQHWNNIGVLRHKTGDLKGAVEAYITALKQSKEEDVCWDVQDAEGTGLVFHATDTTILFNLARVYEDSHMFWKASGVYKGILREYPGYTDCSLRLGCMARARGDISQAQHHFKDTFQVDENNTDAWSLLGNLHIQKREWLPAQKKFERILDNGGDSRHDEYSLLSLGNIYYTAKFDRREKEKQEKYLKNAKNFYSQVIARNAGNMYAANGLGAILAEKGFISQGKEVFLKVREASALHSPMPAVLVNLAHTYLAEGHYINAIKMYQNVITKYSDDGKGDEEVVLYLAKAYYESGKYLEARRTMVKVVMIDPGNMAYRFNLALCEKNHALSMLTSEKPSLSNVKQSVQTLRLCKKTFEWLAAIPPTPKLNFRPSVAGKHVKHVNTCLHKAENQLCVTQAVAQEASRKREEQLAQARDARQRKKQKEEEQRQHEENKKRQLEEEAKKSSKLLEQLKKEWDEEELKVVQASGGSRSSGGGTKGKKQLGKSRYESGSEYSSSDVEDNEGDTSTQKEKKKKKKKKKKEKKKKRRRRRGEGLEEEQGVVEYGEDWRAMRDRRNPRAKQMAERLRQQEEEEKQKQIQAIHAIHGDDDENPIIEGKRRRISKKRYSQPMEYSELDKLVDDEKKEKDYPVIDNNEERKEKEEQSIDELKYNSDNDNNDDNGEGEKREDIPYDPSNSITSDVNNDIGDKYDSKEGEEQMSDN